MKKLQSTESSPVSPSYENNISDLCKTFREKFNQSSTSFPLLHKKTQLYTNFPNNFKTDSGRDLLLSQKHKKITKTRLNNKKFSWVNKPILVEINNVLLREIEPIGIKLERNLESESESEEVNSKETKTQLFQQSGTFSASTVLYEVKAAQADPQRRRRRPRLKKNIFPDFLKKLSTQSFSMAFSPNKRSVLTSRGNQDRRKLSFLKEGLVYVSHIFQKTSGTRTALFLPLSNTENSTRGLIQTHKGFSSLLMTLKRNRGVSFEILKSTKKERNEKTALEKKFCFLESFSFASKEREPIKNFQTEQSNESNLLLSIASPLLTLTKTVEPQLFIKGSSGSEEKDRLKSLPPVQNTSIKKKEVFEKKEVLVPEKEATFFTQLKLSEKMPISILKNRTTSLLKKFFRTPYVVLENKKTTSLEIPKSALLKEKKFFNEQMSSEDSSEIHTKKGNLLFFLNTSKNLKNEKDGEFFFAKESHDKTFFRMPYRKPFFSYWLLPFMGLMTLIPDSKLRALHNNFKSDYLLVNEQTEVLNKNQNLTPKFLKLPLPFLVSKKALLSSPSMPRGLTPANSALPLLGGIFNESKEPMSLSTVALLTQPKDSFVSFPNLFLTKLKKKQESVASLQRVASQPRGLGLQPLKKFESSLKTNQLNNAVFPKKIAPVVDSNLSFFTSSDSEENRFSYEKKKSPFSSFSELVTAFLPTLSHSKAEILLENGIKKQISFSYLKTKKNKTWTFFLNQLLLKKLNASIKKPKIHISFLTSEAKSLNSAFKEKKNSAHRLSLLSVERSPNQNQRGGVSALKKHYSFRKLVENPKNFLLSQSSKSIKGAKEQEPVFLIKKLKHSLYLRSLLNQLAIFRNLISLSTEIPKPELLFFSKEKSPDIILAQDKTLIQEPPLLLPGSPFLQLQLQRASLEVSTKISEDGEQANKKNQSKKIPSLKKLCDQIFISSCLNKKSNSFGVLSIKNKTVLPRQTLTNQTIVRKPGLGKLIFIGDNLSENPKGKKKLIEGSYISWLKNEFSFISSEKAHFPNKFNQKKRVKDVSNSKKLDKEGVEVLTIDALAKDNFDRFGFFTGFKKGHSAPYFAEEKLGQKLIRKGLLSLQRTDSSKARSFPKNRFFFREEALLSWGQKKTGVFSEQEDILKMQQPILISGFNNNLLGKQVSLIKKNSILKPSQHLESNYFSYPFLNFNYSLNTPSDLSNSSHTQSEKQQGLPFFLSKSFSSLEKFQKDGLLILIPSKARQVRSFFSNNIPEKFGTRRVPVLTYLKRKELHSQKKGEQNILRPKTVKKGSDYNNRKLYFDKGELNIASIKKVTDSSLYSSGKGKKKVLSSFFLLCNAKQKSYLTPVQDHRFFSDKTFSLKNRVKNEKGVRMDKLFRSFLSQPLSFSGSSFKEKQVGQGHLFSKGNQNSLLPTRLGRVNKGSKKNTIKLKNLKRKLGSELNAFLSFNKEGINLTTDSSKICKPGKGLDLLLLKNTSPFQVNKTRLFRALPNEEFLEEKDLNLLKKKSTPSDCDSKKGGNKLAIQNKINNKASNLLFNNRFNFSRKVEKQRTNLSSETNQERKQESNSPYIKDAIKNLKKKRRAVKQKRETGRLLKRKRFHPRPAWVRVTMYKKFLKYRHRKSVLSGLEIQFDKKKAYYVPLEVKRKGLILNKTSPIFNRFLKKKSLLSYNTFFEKGSRAVNCFSRSGLGTANFAMAFSPRKAITKETLLSRTIQKRIPSFAFKRKISTYATNELNHLRVRNSISSSIASLGNLMKERDGKRIAFDYQQKDNESNLISLVSLERKTPFLSKKARKNNYFFPPTVEKAYYNISQTVFAEFQQGLWKSSWLRTNLNSYLRKIKNSFLLIKKTSQNSVESKRFNLIFANKTNENPSLKWNTVLRIAEYNQITYNRIQQIISNLKHSTSDSSFRNFVETPTSFSQQPSDSSFDGSIIKKQFEVSFFSSTKKKEPKKRPFNNARHKFKKPISKDLTIFSFANTVIQTPRALKDTIHKNLTENPFFTIQSFGNMSKKRVYWALNKTHMWQFKNSNKKEYLWANQKQREQNRSNKTKQIIKKILTLINVPLQELPLRGKPYLSVLKNKEPINSFSLRERDTFETTTLIPSSQNEAQASEQINKKRTKEEEFVLSPLLSDSLKTESLPNYNYGKGSVHTFEAPIARSNGELEQSNGQKWQKSLNTFLKKQKQKENKMGDLGFFESKGFFRFKERLPVLLNNSNLSFFKFFSVPLSDKKFNTASLEGIYKEAFMSQKNSLLKEHRLFLRNLKTTLRVSSHTKKNQFGNHFSYRNLSDLEKKSESEGNAFAKNRNYVKHNFLTVPLLGANNTHFFNLIQRKQKNHFFRKELNQTRKQFLAIGGTYHFPQNKISNQNGQKQSTFFKKEGYFPPFGGLESIPPLLKEGFSCKIFFVCTIIFHLCSLFSLVSISQIRDVIKFLVLFGLKLSAFAKVGGLVPSLKKNSQSTKKVPSPLNPLFPYDFSKSFLALTPLHFLSDSVGSNPYYNYNKGGVAEDDKLYIVRNFTKKSKNIKIKRVALLYFKSLSSIGPILKNKPLLLKSKLFLPIPPKSRKRNVLLGRSAVRSNLHPVFNYHGNLFLNQPAGQWKQRLIKISLASTGFLLFLRNQSLEAKEETHRQPKEALWDTSMVQSSSPKKGKVRLKKEGKEGLLEKLTYPKFLLLPKLVFFMNRLMLLKNASLKPFLKKTSTSTSSDSEFRTPTLNQKKSLEETVVLTNSSDVIRARFFERFLEGVIRPRTKRRSFVQSDQINSINLRATKTKSFLLNTFLKYGFKKMGSIFHNSVSTFTDIRNTGIQSIAIFLGKPGESSSVWINNLFLIEVASDLTTTIPENSDSAIWNIFTKLAKSSSLRILPVLGTLLEKRLFSSFELFIERLSQPDTDLIVRQQKGKIFWDIWGEVLKNVAEENNINIELLANKKEDQSFLLSKLLENDQQQPKLTFGLLPKLWASSFTTNGLPSTRILSLTPPTDSVASFYLRSNLWGLGQQGLEKRELLLSESEGVPLFPLSFVRREKFHHSNSPLGYGGSSSIVSINRKERVRHTSTTTDSFNTNWRRWSANQYMTFKGKDSDLLIQAPPAPKSFHSLYPSGSVAREGYNSFKKNSGIGQNYNLNASSLVKGIAPLGTIICQIYSGLFSKETAKNFLVVGTALNQTISSSSSSSYLKEAGKNANYDEKSLLIQSLAGETEMKIIRDNANRYNFALGIKSLRNVFDALALHTPCIFLIEDIHVIGERRPLLVGDDENAAGSAASGEHSSGSGESHDEKNLSMAKLTRHSVMHYRKPFRGDFSFLIPANNYSFDLFLGAPTYEIMGAGRAKQMGSSSYGRVAPMSPIPLESSFSDSAKKSKENFLIRASNFQSSRQFSKRNFSLKTQNIVKELPWIGLAEQLTSHISMKGAASSSSSKEGSSSGSSDSQREASSRKPGVSLQNSLPKIKYSIRVKIALLASLAVSNLSVKLNMITDLLVIIDSVRSNRGFVVFATTHTPSILDPALRRPGRLDETIALPFIPKLESRWEIVKSNVASLNSGSSSFSSLKNPAPSFFYTGILGTAFSPRTILTPYPLWGLEGGFNKASFLAPFLKAKGDSGFPSGLTVDLLDYGLFNLSLSKGGAFLQTFKTQKKLTISKKNNVFSNKKKWPISSLTEEKAEFRKSYPSMVTPDLPYSNSVGFLKTINFFKGFRSNPFSYPISIGARKKGFRSLREERRALLSAPKPFFNFVRNQKVNRLNRINESFILDNILEPSSFTQEKSGFFLQKDRFLPKLPGSFTGRKSTNVFPKTPLQKKSFALKKGLEGTDSLRSKATLNLFNKNAKNNRNSPSNMALRAAYSKIGQFLINNKFVSCADANLSLFSPLHAKLETQITSSGPGNNSSLREEGLLKIPASPYLHLYTKQNNIKQYLIGLFAPKVSETLAFSSNKKLPSDSEKPYQNTFYLENKVKSPSYDELNIETKTALYIPLPTVFKDPITTNPHLIPNFGLWSLQGIDKTWRAASSLIFTLIEKRLIYKKTVIIPKLLQFFNAAVQKSSLQDAPSPPASFLLLPAKRYENYKRSFLAMQFGVSTSFSSSGVLKGPTELGIGNSNLFLPLLSNPSKVTRAKSDSKKAGNTKSVKKNLSVFSVSSLKRGLFVRKDSALTKSPLLKRVPPFGKQVRKKQAFNLVPLIRTKDVLRSKDGEEFFDKPTVFNGYYRSRILDRHRGYLNNQWWNGQLYEHNVETTFLSDIDWRSNFVAALSSKKEKQTIFRKPSLDLKSSRFFVTPDSKELYTIKNKGFLFRRFRNLLSLRSRNNQLTKSFGSGLITTSSDSDLEEENREKILDSSKTPILISKVSGLPAKNQEKEDFFIDFPDFDQHYNPGNRRWILHFGYWSYWYNFKTTHNSEIQSYIVTEAFLTTFNFLNSNREILDYFVTKIMKSGLIKETSIVDGLKRF